VLPEDLLKFGLIPEFVGRLPVVGVVHNLDKDALIRILVEPKNALLRQYQKFFQFDDVELVFTDDALGAIADRVAAMASVRPPASTVVSSGRPCPLMRASFRCPACLPP